VGSTGRSEAGAGLDEVAARRLGEPAGADLLVVGEVGVLEDNLDDRPGGVRTLDALLDVMNLGVTRIGATATEAMILDFRARKAGLAPATTATAETGGY